MDKTLRRLTALLLILAVIGLCFPQIKQAAAEPDIAGQPQDGTSQVQVPLDQDGNPLPSGTPTPEPTPEAMDWPIQSDDIKGWPKGPRVEAEAAIVMEATTGSILYAKNMDEKRFPASITKIMTTLLALENCNLQEKVTFSESAIGSIGPDSSSIGGLTGEEMTMEQCLYAVMLASANEVSSAVAEHVAGSIEAFVDMMNAKAKALGCTHTHFHNANGLPDEEHYTTARDMALIAREAWRNPSFRKITGTTEYQISATNKMAEIRYLANHHKMLCTPGYQYDGCVGGKTGYTDAAMNTLVTYARRRDMTLICVALRTNGLPIYTDTRDMLDYGFANFQNKKIARPQTHTFDPKFMPSLQLLFANQGAVQIGETLDSYHVTLPGGIKTKELNTTKERFSNAVGPWRVRTNYYYEGNQVGYSYEYEKEVLSGLLLYMMRYNHRSIEGRSEGA